MIAVKWTLNSFNHVANLSSALSANIIQILYRNENVSILSKDILINTYEKAPDNVKPFLESIFTKLSDENKIINNTNIPEKSFVVGFFDHNKENKPQGCEWFSIYARDIVEESLSEIVKNGKTAFCASKYKSDQEIQNFIATIVSLPNSRKLTIISRYCTFNSTVIKCLGSNFENIEIWTVDPKIINKNDLIKIWKRSFNVYKGNCCDLHERAVIVGECLLIIFDDEFDKINKSYNTWTITVLICTNTVKDKYKKKSLLHKVNI